MEKESSFSYFDAYTAQANYAQEMALNLQSALKADELGGEYLMNALHTVENDADQVNHTIQAHLQTDFVVPFERDSMNSLAHALDDAADAIEDIAIQAYIYHCAHFEAEGPEMVKLICLGCSELVLAVSDLSNISKAASVIKEHLINIQTYESDCDQLYMRSAHSLYEREDLSDEQRRIAHAMISALEDAMDTLENAAERIESVMTENA